jgi:SAM-dependent methyltransferase
MSVVSGPPAWVAQRGCWVCGGSRLHPIGMLKVDLNEYRGQDPELAELSGARIALNRCADCGFGQPAALPALDQYFDRMYDQRWSAEWISAEYNSTVKDFIFERILAALSRRLPDHRRALLDVGAHAGRFISLAQRAGWRAEGLELNPRTASFAARATGARIRHANIQEVHPDGNRYDAITLTDVLEHMPHPRRVLHRLREWLAPGGCVAIKVPCGPAQVIKERWRGRLRPTYEPTVADNLVHVSHFSPRSLKRALEDAGFVDVVIEPGAPELPPRATLSGHLSHALRLASFRVATIAPRGIDSPFCLNLQAYASVRGS